MSSTAIIIEGYFYICREGILIYDHPKSDIIYIVEGWTEFDNRLFALLFT